MGILNHAINIKKSTLRSSSASKTESNDKYFNGKYFSSKTHHQGITDNIFKKRQLRGSTDVFSTKNIFRGSIYHSTQFLMLNSVFFISNIAFGTNGRRRASN